MRKDFDLIVSAVIGVIAVILVGLFTSIRVAGGRNGMYGGWGFEIFVAVFVVAYLTIAGVRRIFRKSR